MKNIIGNVVQMLAILVFVYFTVANVAFSLNNPTANEFQAIMHFKSLLTFESLEKFQGN